MWKGIVAASAIAAGLAVPVTADAATTSTTRDLSTARARCEAAIDVRLAKLDKLDNRVTNAKRLTDAHRQTATNINSKARAGLTDLRTKISQDNDAAVLRQDCRSIVLDYRIFALRAPQEYLAIAGDAESAVVAKLESIEPKIQDAIDRAKANGKDVSGAQTAFDDLKAKVADAAKQDDKVADTVLGYTPADYSANHNVLLPARTAVKAAAVDLHAARDDVRTIVHDLRSQSATTTSTTGA